MEWWKVERQVIKEQIWQVNDRKEDRKLHGIE